MEDDGGQFKHRERLCPPCTQEDDGRRDGALCVKGFIYRDRRGVHHLSHSFSGPDDKTKSGELEVELDEVKDKTTQTVPHMTGPRIIDPGFIETLRGPLGSQLRGSAIYAVLRRKYCSLTLRPEKIDFFYQLTTFQTPNFRASL
uniref:Uncharacterized protein n=1 Tax=Schistocephalus solidus TaxID=70667 RepID=A0A0X3Q176_SCHSO